VRLLVVTNLFHPDRGGGASVFSDLCFGLAERGHDVTVYCAYPYYPEWQNTSHANLWRVTRERVNGVHVRRFGMYIPANPSRLGPRLLFELSFACGLMRSLVYLERFDAVMAFCPAMGSVAYAAARKLVYREPTWLNVQDIPADAAAASGISKGRLAGGLGQRVQSLLFNRADVWSTIAPKMVERLEGVRRRGQPVHLVPNFLNRSMADEISRHAVEVGRPVGRPARLLYAGNIGSKQDLVSLCAALHAVDVDFTFTIHGSGSEAGRVRDWVDSTGDDRFRFGGFLGEREFVDALFEADVFVITERAGVGASFMPSKLIPCIASGTPVLAVCDRDGPLGREVDDFELGLTLDWSDAESLGERLRRFVEDPSAVEDAQRSALARARAYERTHVIERVARELAGLASDRRVAHVASA
jgi:colanic acid biosynthesis glycosyl transferase WcaI